MKKIFIAVIILMFISCVSIKPINRGSTNINIGDDIVNEKVGD